MSEKPVEIMIVTGEASGDLHGARLVEALHSLLPSCRFYGMGGEEMERAGVEILFDAEKIAVMGVVEVVARGADIFRAQRTLRAALHKRHPDLLVIIDLPDFNLLLAKSAKKLGIPVYYYICPQVWAWRSGRVKTLQQRVDGLGVILPFEEPFYKKHGIAAHYVGHPLLDSVAVRCSRDQFLAEKGLDPARKYIGLLPGSRKREVASLLPIFFQAAVLISKNSAQAPVFLLPQASTIAKDDLLQAGLEEYQQEIEIVVMEDDRYETMAACSAVIAASGTVTLELAILQVPMVVAYRLAKLTYMLGKLLVKIDFFSLVNLVAGRKIVPELLQDEVSAERIAAEILPLLADGDADDGEKRQQMEDGLAAVKAALGKPGASQRVAGDIVQLLEKRVSLF